MLGSVLITLFFLMAPAGVLWLCRRFPLAGKVGPVLLLYLTGILVGNVFHPPGMARVQEALSSAMVPLAIPLMLFSCTFRRSGTRSQLLALLSGLAAVTVAVVAGYFLFGRSLDDGAKVGGMLTGVYTGGTINLASLQVMLDVPVETFVLLNSFDMAVSFLYLTFLLSFGIRIFRRWLPGTAEADGAGSEADAVNAGQPPTEKVVSAVSAPASPASASLAQPAPAISASPASSALASVAQPAPAASTPPASPASASVAPAGPAGGGEERPYRGLFTRPGLRDAGVLLAADALIIGVSAGLGLLAGDGAFMTVLILMLTTLGIAASFWKPLKERRYGYEMGMYFIYVFSIVVASMADLRNLSVGGSLTLLAYLAFVVFGSLLLQVLLARLLRIDADTMTVSSVAYICSPAFVPMMTAAMKNRRVLAGGLAVGVVGYAAGNYLGLLISQLLTLF